MLSNITNYLFGGCQNNISNEKENVNFHEVEEDDWMVIDKLGTFSNLKFFSCFISVLLFNYLSINSTLTLFFNSIINL